MKLENTLSIPVPPEEAWKVLLDIERVAPCVPGATLTSQDGDVFHGKIKVKLGPIALTYNGTVAFLSQDADAGVAVLAATGRETRGNGTAKATVTCRLVGSGETTEVLVETDLAITGKPAQFGRGALAEVAGALIGQFATNLAAEITAAPETSPAAVAPDPAAMTPGPAAATPDRGATTRGPAAAGPGRAAGGPATHAARPESAPLDLLAVAGGGAVVKRLAPVVAGTTLLLLFLTLRRYLGRRAARRAAAA
jgi:carbon monoxide dehydrogenase subunit G